MALTVSNACDQFVAMASQAGVACDSFVWADDFNIREQQLASLEKMQIESSIGVDPYRFDGPMDELLDYEYTDYDHQEVNRLSIMVPNLTQLMTRYAVGDGKRTPVMIDGRKSFNVDLEDASKVGYICETLGRIVPTTRTQLRVQSVTEMSGMDIP